MFRAPARGHGRAGTRQAAGAGPRGRPRGPSPRALAFRRSTATPATEPGQRTQPPGPPWPVGLNPCSRLPWPERRRVGASEPLPGLSPRSTSGPAGGRPPRVRGRRRRFPPSTTGSRGATSNSNASINRAVASDTTRPSSKTSMAREVGDVTGVDSQARRIAPRVTDDPDHFVRFRAVAAASTRRSAAPAPDS